MMDPEFVFTFVVFWVFFTIMLSVTFGSVVPTNKGKSSILGEIPIRLQTDSDNSLLLLLIEVKRCGG